MSVLEEDMSTTETKDQHTSSQGQRTKDKPGKEPATLARRGPTGPRTQRGKMKSRYNALKHGIFANVVLKRSVLREKQEDYENLLQAFRENLQPEGGLEEFLVEKLAQIAWRKGRAVRAEAAIVRKQTEFLRQDHDARLKEASEGSGLDLARFTGITRVRRNPYLLRKSLDNLDILKGGIETRGFEPVTDEHYLGILYGQCQDETLFLTYKICANEAEQIAKNSPTPKAAIEEYKRGFLEVLDLERKRIVQTLRDLEARNEVEGPLEEESLAIPQGKELDRLLRYEARLEGEFDRTLQQLERLQRMRRGEAVPPTIKVDVTR